MSDSGQHPPPLVVGGTGGSGTRVVTRILIYAGRYMGADRNETEDAIAFAPFDYRWTPPFLAASRNGGEMSGEQQAAMAAEFAAARDRHRTPMEDPAAPWGWKHAPSTHLLPFLCGVYPGLRFVHVIRDGRDFAFGTRGARIHTVQLGGAVLDADPTPVERQPDRAAKPTPLRMAQFWVRVHAACADYGEALLGDRYLRIRLEDLCARPEQVLPELFAFAEAGSTDPDGIRSEIETPANIGSWRDRDPAEIEPVLAAGGPTLRRFGYVD